MDLFSWDRPSIGDTNNDIFNSALLTFEFNSHADQRRIGSANAMSMLIPPSDRSFKLLNDLFPLFHSLMSLSFIDDLLLLLFFCKINTAVARVFGVGERSFFALNSAAEKINLFLSKLW